MGYLYTFISYFNHGSLVITIIMLMSLRNWIMFKHETSPSIIHRINPVATHWGPLHEISVKKFTWTYLKLQIAVIIFIMRCHFIAQRLIFLLEKWQFLAKRLIFLCQTASETIVSRKSWSANPMPFIRITGSPFCIFFLAVLSISKLEEDKSLESSIIPLEGHSSTTYSPSSIDVSYGGNKYIMV